MKIIPVIVLLSSLLGGVALGQTGPPAALYFTPGTVLARGLNASAEGFYGLKTYRIEQVRLAAPIALESGGRRQTVDRAFRVIVTGDTFVVRAMPALVWADGNLVGHAQESQDQTEIVAVTFDATLIPDGAALAVSYSVDGERQVLRERIHYTVRP